MDPSSWVQILTALLTPTIAILGSYIAYQQWRTNRLRYKHELFDKRFKMFEASMELIATILRNGKVSEEERIKFLVGTKGSKFIFGSVIATYLDELHKKAVELQTLQACLEGVGVGQERSSNVKEQSEIKMWFARQLEAIEGKFYPYLSLEP